MARILESPLSDVAAATNFYALRGLLNALCHVFILEEVDKVLLNLLGQILIQLFA
jgi:hypothetical protein